MPVKLGMRGGQHHCEKYSGNITVIKDSKMWDSHLAKYFTTTNIATTLVWTGYSDEASEGQFVDIVEGKKLTDELMFAEGQPSGDGNFGLRLENFLPM